MLVPQYSLRWILGLTLGVILLSLVGQQAYAGAHWAVGILAACGALVALFVLLAILYFVVAGLARIASWFQPGEVGSSPFATHNPPPQWVPSQRE